MWHPGWDIIVDRGSEVHRTEITMNVAITIKQLEDSYEYP